MEKYFFKCCRECVESRYEGNCHFKICRRYRRSYKAYMENARRIAEELRKGEVKGKKIVIK